MALPNFKYYYWASNIRILKYWLCPETAPPPDWLVMERNSVKPVSLAALLYSPIQCPTKKYTKNRTVHISLKIWIQLKKHFGLQLYSYNAPLAENHVFLPSLTDRAFLVWHTHGIRTFKDLFINNVFASFQQLSTKFSLPKQHFFRYLQVRSFVHSTFSTFPNLPETSILDSLLSPPTKLKGSISLLYNQISSIRLDSLNSIKALWEEDLGETISDELWSQILKRVHKSSICAKYCLIQCKLLHRVYYTKSRLSKIYPNISPSCDRCQISPGNLIHTFWLCPRLFSYWSGIFDTISKVLGREIKPNPFSALFGVYVGPPSLSSVHSNQLAFMTLLARRIILLKWKSPLSPSHTHWIKDVLYFLKLDKIRMTLHGSSDKFIQTWSPLFRLVKQTNFPCVPD